MFLNLVFPYCKSEHLAKVRETAMSMQVDKNVFLHGDKNIFSSSLQFLADLSSN